MPSRPRRSGHEEAATASPTIAGHSAAIPAATSPRDSKDLAVILPINEDERLRLAAEFAHG